MFLAAVLASLALVVPGPAPQEEPAAGVDHGALFLEALRATRGGEGEPAFERAGAVAALGPAVAPLILDALATGGVGAGDGLEVVTPGDREVLLAACRRLGRAPFAETLVEWTAPEQERARRAAALEVLGEVASLQDVGLMLSAVGGADHQSEPDTALLDRLRVCVTRLLADEPGAYEVLGRRFPDVHPRVAATLAGSVGEGTTLDALGWLCARLDVQRGLQACLLGEARKVALHLTPPVDDALCSRVRPLLWSDDRQVLRGAIQLGAALQDFEAVERLAELLDSPDDVVHDAALAALHDITGLRFPDRSGRWLAWLEQERRWHEQDLDVLLRLLASGRAFDVQRALTELARHRIERHRIAEAVADVLDSRDAETVVRACGVLRQLGSAVALERLEALVEDGDRAVVREAKKTLRALRGVERNARPSSPRPHL